MSAIREQISMRCPVGEAEQRLAQYFAQRRGNDGTTRMQLRVRIDQKGLLAGLALEHEVSVDARIARDDQNLNNVLQISWKPVDGGAFPEFAGTIVAWADRDPQTTFLELRGAYVPPGGSGGVVFDEAVGRAIAHYTARTLLQDICRSIGDRMEARS